MLSRKPRPSGDQPKESTTSLDVEDSDMLTILSDSQAAIQIGHNMSRGAPPRSGIEKDIKSAIFEARRDVKIAWVRGHIGIKGNEKADKRAALESILGQMRGSPRMVTEGGLRAASKVIRRDSREARRKAGFGTRAVSDWSRQAFSAFTWMRTNRGPQKSWLHRIGKAATAEWYPSEDGDHLTFDCPRFR